jgi:hypothetical protein
MTPAERQSAAVMKIINAEVEFIGVCDSLGISDIEKNEQ